MAIRVLNQKLIRGKGVRGTYIGRPHPEFGGQGSPLQNPFTVKEHGHSQAITLYSEWLRVMFKLAAGKIRGGEGQDFERLARIWRLAQKGDVEREWARACAMAAEISAELNRLADIAEREDLNLICWCVRNAEGEGACHGHFVAHAIEAIIQKRRAGRAAPTEDEPTPDDTTGSGGMGSLLNLPLAAIIASHTTQTLYAL